MLYFKEKKRGPTFSGGGGGQLFPGVCVCVGGVQMLISIETYRTCDFPGGGGGLGPPISPRDPRMGCDLHANDSK